MIMCIVFTFDPYGMIIRMFHGEMRAIEYMQLDAKCPYNSKIARVPTKESLLQDDVGREDELPMMQLMQ